MKISFYPEQTPEEKRASRIRKGRQYANRARAAKYDQAQAKLTTAEKRIRKILKSPWSRAWYAKVQDYANGDTGDYNSRWDCLRDLAIRGRSLELAGNIDDEGSFTILAWAGHENGDFEDRNFHRTIMRGRAYADTNHLEGLHGNMRNSICAREVDISIGYQVQSLADYTSTTSMPRGSKTFAYTIMNYAKASNTDTVTLSLRVMAKAFGWKSDNSVRQHIAKVEKFGIFTLDHGREYNKGSGPQSITFRLDLDRFPAEPVAEAVVDLDQFKDVAEAFRSARKARAGEERQRRADYRKSTNTSAVVDPEPKPDHADFTAWLHNFVNGGNS
ncbi:hypothetical protein ACTOB_003054 [Actinoplanes oblitus]|uniref:Replication protein n=1 Tax=Actinoplanes oblitus TaxID=3040509 RepID=A0ABY8WS54_9ACTN|nr:hypothetical protein [Actinoplanes oblitus]WIM99403.1 hypothetical protein ACTOB_003054 [Actinoplanes oblitus]